MRTYSEPQEKTFDRESATTRTACTSAFYGNDLRVPTCVKVEVFDSTEHPVDVVKPKPWGLLYTKCVPCHTMRKRHVADAAIWLTFVVLLSFLCTVKGYLWGPSLSSGRTTSRRLLSGIDSVDSSMFVAAFQTPRSAHRGGRQCRIATCREATTTDSDSGISRLESSQATSECVDMVGAGGLEMDPDSGATEKGVELMASLVVADVDGTATSTSPSKGSHEQDVEVGLAMVIDGAESSEGASMLDGEDYVMSSMLDDVVVRLKGAADSITPVFRAEDGRLSIDGNGLLNLVRDGGLPARSHGVDSTVQREST